MRLNLLGNEYSNYFISYASTDSHSFLIITKQIKIPDDTKIKNIVIASFGLYGEDNEHIASILTCGRITENGRLRSDHFFLQFSRLL